MFLSDSVYRTFYPFIEGAIKTKRQQHPRDRCWLLKFLHVECERTNSETTINDLHQKTILHLCSSLPSSPGQTRDAQPRKAKVSPPSHAENPVQVTESWTFGITHPFMYVECHLLETIHRI